MKKAFVIMSFKPEYNQIYSQSIKPAFDKMGYKCSRVDEDYGPKNISIDIIKSIINANIVLADISEDSPNVFYELGVSHSVGNKTITIMSRGDDKIPFDLSHYRAIQYDNTDQGLKLLRFDISEAIKELERDNMMQPNNPVQEAGKDFFDLRRKIEEKLKALNDEIHRTEKFNKFIKNDFPKKDNNKVAKQIINHIRRLIHRDKTILLSICGSGAVGKGTFAEVLKNSIEQELNSSVDILPTDSYMLSRADRIQWNLIGFDCKANDLKQFYQDVEDLVEKNTKAIITPYNHKTGEHGKETEIKPSDIIILEGIYSFYPELKNLSQRSTQLKYFIYADKFKAKELKFISDIKERGHNIHTALQHAVPEYSAYETYVLPYIRHADYIIRVDGYWEYSMPFTFDEKMD